MEDDNFDEALNLLDQACTEGLDLDVLLFNGILERACKQVMFLMSLYLLPSLPL